MSQGYKANQSLISNQQTQSSDIMIDIFSIDNPKSVINSLKANASFFKKEMAALPEELRDQDQFTMRQRIKPTPTLNQLRLNFWAEYDRIIVTDQKMVMAHVIKGVCSIRLMKAFCMDAENLAWILTPVQSYQAGVQDVLETALYKMRVGLEKLQMETASDINAAMKVYDIFDKRINGENVKKLEIKSEKINNTEIKNAVIDLGINNDVVVEYDKTE